MSWTRAPRCGANVYCPKGDVTRAQMASFSVRARDLAPASTSPFHDIAGNTHEADIRALAAVGICSPTAYCPDDPVTRAQMASSLVRALGL